MEYTVIQFEQFAKDKFIAEVNRLIRAGWTPLGGVCCTGNGWLFQAMIKKP
jgi:hypothetical protein